MLASIPESLTMYPGLKIRFVTTEITRQELQTIRCSLYPCPASESNLNRLLELHPAFLSLLPSEKVTGTSLCCDYTYSLSSPLSEDSKLNAS